MHNQILGKRRDNSQVETIYSKHDFNPDEIWFYWCEMIEQVAQNYARGCTNNNTEHSYTVLYLCAGTLILETCNQYDQ
jgi:hypothetical protein